MDSRAHRQKKSTSRPRIFSFPVGVKSIYPLPRAAVTSRQVGSLGPNVCRSEMLIKRPREPLHGRTRGEGRRRAYGRGVSVGGRSLGLELCHESGTFETYFVESPPPPPLLSARPLSPFPSARSTRFPRNPRLNEISAPCNAISWLAVNDSTGGTEGIDRSGNAQWSLPVSVRPTYAKTCLMRSCVAAEV